MGKVLKFFIVIIFVFLIIFYFYQKKIDSPQADKGEDVVFIVSPGEGVNQISQNLWDQGLIKSKFIFEVYVWQIKKEEKIQAGEYILNPILSIKSIVDILARGQTINKEKVITIIEGWNTKDIGAYLEKNDFSSSENFLKLVGYPKTDYRTENKDVWPKDYASKFDFLIDKPSYVGLEGYLFPDTYRVYNNSTQADIVSKMLENFDKKLTDEMRAEIARQNKSIYEIITMASIIEKEVRSVDDMKIVSGIFWDRIKNGQALQSCATLAYILEENKPQYSFADTQIESSYNTYKYRGLPPGPICNPGEQAIQAAIYPTFTDYNYFLTSKTGETIFSKTLSEHNANKVKYLK